jgi:two-component system sensor histidine kinase PilS (NtrC family)
MSRSASISFSQEPGLVRKVQSLIVARLGLIFLLLLASWWWTNGLPESTAIDSFPSALSLFFLVSIGLSGVYYLALRLNNNRLLQLRIQFSIDILFVTGLVWQTGDLLSPYITLYVILVCVAGFFLSKTDTLLLAASCVGCFTLLTVLTGQSLLFSFSGEARPSRMIQIIGFNNVAILLVGLLAARLSERRRVAEELKETAASFADLNILHERIVQSIGSGLITTDLDGKIYAFNRAAEEISGLRADETIGESVFSLLGEEIRPAVGLCLGAADGSGYLSGQFEAKMRAALRKDGSRRRVTVSCSVSPLFGRHGRFSGLIITFQDVTQIRALEETVRRSDRLAAVGRMAAGLAHEIRNPLGSMSSALQFMQEKSRPTPEEASLMNVVLRESDRLNGIITNFLAYARPSANGFSREMTEMDIGQALRDCFSLLRHSPDVRDSHVLDCELPKIPVTLTANETEIKQVFWNLLQNSIQAMPDGGRLYVRLNDAPDKFVRIEFQDTGCGIGAEARKHLFEPFAIGARGMGLGLSIVHKIVTDHGGRIDVQSAVKKGTRITVDLPR